MNSLLNSYYTKTIRLTPNGFSLYRCDSKDKMHVRHCKYVNNELITTTAPDFFNFDKEENPEVDVIVATRIPVLVPDTLYEDDKVNDYLRIQYDLTHFGQSFNDKLAQYQAVYFLEQNEKSTFENLGCQTNFHSDALLLYQFLMEQNTPEAILLAMNETFADVVVLHKQEPMLINRIQHIDNIDVLYQLLNDIKQFGLVEPTIFVQSFYESNSKLHNLLKKYLSNIVIL